MNHRVQSILQRATHTYFDPPKDLPSSGVTDAPLCGNGDIGIAAGGTSDLLQCYFSKNDMWCARPAHIGGGMKSLGVLEFALPRLKGGEFRAWQRMDSAEVSLEAVTRGHRARLDVYAPRGQSMIVARVTCLEGRITVQPRLQANHDPLARVTYAAKDGVHLLTKDYVDGVQWPTLACAAMKVIGRGEGEISLGLGESFSVAVVVATNHDRDDHIAWASAAADALDGEALLAYRAQHVQWWDAFWDESAVFLPDEPEIEKFWYASQYILACCCEKGKFAPGIFGNFITNDAPNWGGDYHLNYNHEAPWWGVYSSNKVALSEPYDTPLMEYIPRARENARSKLNCRGIYAKVGIGPKGNEISEIYTLDGTPCEDAAFWGQKSNAAYAATDMVMRFYHTWDEDYARRIAYPYLTEVANFWEDYLVFEDGRYVVVNDCIHENAADAIGCFEWAREDVVDYRDDRNAILTLGLLRMVFRAILEVSHFLDADADRRERWRHILDHLSDFPVQVRGGREVFRYTEHGMDWCDSNTLGIQHIYPAGAIGLGSDERLLTLASSTLEELGRWRDYNGFPTFYAAAVRIGYDPDTILDRMREQLRLHGLPNLYVYYGGGGIECCSGVPGAVNEMLVQSHEGMLRFFPVWNREKDASFSKLRTYGAFIVSGEIHKGKIGEIALMSEKGREACVLSPWPEGMRITENGEPIKARREDTAGGSVYRFDTRPGARYALRPAK